MIACSCPVESCVIRRRARIADLVPAYAPAMAAFNSENPQRYLGDARAPIAGGSDRHGTMDIPSKRDATRSASSRSAGPSRATIIVPDRSHPPRAATTALALLVAGAWLVLAPTPAHADDSAVMRALRSGGVAIFLRHTRTTPGVGDPPGWKLGDCSTQRNLDAGGRAHAKRVGEWFSRKRIVPTVVRNSPWCRTRDTARLAFGRSEDWSALANLFENRAPEKSNVEDVRRYVAALAEGEIAVLVSHGSSISAFVGEYLAQGEAVVVRAERDAKGEVKTVVIGRIAVP
jgi:phosphohistidine phosphatase SixA